MDYFVCMKEYIEIHFLMGLFSCLDLESNNNWCENNWDGHANQSLGLAISIAIIMDTKVKRVLGKFNHITTTTMWKDYKAQVNLDIKGELISTLNNTPQLKSHVLIMSWI